MNTIENNWLTNSNDYEERERWKKIVEARERKQRKFRRQYQLVEVKDYLNWEAPAKEGKKK